MAFRYLNVANSRQLDKNNSETEKLLAEVRKKLLELSSVSEENLSEKDAGLAYWIIATELLDKTESLLQREMLWKLWQGLPRSISSVIKGMIRNCP